MNTAGRLLSVYDQLLARSQKTDAPMTRVWGEIFELGGGTHQLEDEAVICLQALRAEVSVLSAKLLSLGVPKALMQQCIVRILNVTSVKHLHTGVRSLVNEITPPENRLALEWANWALRDDSEGDMPVEELDALRKELDSLEASVQETEMTTYLQEFIQRQIDVIRNALRVYRVQGVKPIEEALHQVAGAYTVEKAVVEAQQEHASEATRSLFARAATVIKRTAEVADNLDKVRKAGEGAYTLAARVGPVLLTYGQKISEVILPS